MSSPAGSPVISKPFRTAAVLAGALVVVLLAIAPFAAALEIHHALAEADHDGHEHSDHDLCQWVQHHSASSVDLGVSDLGVLATPQEYAPPPQAAVTGADLVATGPPRAPPSR
jgi:hypothetical protein